MTTQLDDDLDRDVARMIEDTEKEIFEDATGGTGWNLGNEFLEEMSNPDGWDGTPLSDEEQFARNLHGDLESGYDRPLALQEEFQAQAENEQLRAQLVQREQELAQLIQGPQVQAQMQAHQEARRQFLWDMSFDDAKTDAHLAYLDHLQGQVNKAAESRANASMRSAHERYGSDFENAYQQLTSMDPRSPLARELVAQVVRSDDPGEALMGIGHSDVVRGLGNAPGVRPPPFMAGTRGHAPISSRDIEEGNFNSGYGDEGIERDIADYANRKAVIG